jgi:hypothetical protein
MVDVFGGGGGAAAVLSRLPELFRHRPEGLAAKLSDIQVGQRAGRFERNPSSDSISVLGNQAAVAMSERRLPRRALAGAAPRHVCCLKGRAAAPPNLQNP